MITVVGAGSVGLTVGARLACAGRPVRFAVRREEVARALREDGAVVEDLVTGELRSARVDAACGVPPGAPGPILFCVRANDTEAAARQVAAAAPRATAVSVQNGVDNEALLAECFPRVIGVAYRQTCTLVERNRSVTTGAGRVVIGAHPEGLGADVEELGAAFRDAGYDVGLSPRIGADKWLKLCVNLLSAPNALVRRHDHTSRAFVEVKARLLEEARDVLAAAGIVAASCDGRDRSLDGEIAWQRGALERGDSARPLPLYNAAWTALKRGLPLEHDLFHDRISALGDTNGVPTPVNTRVAAALRHAWRSRRGPESLPADSLLR